MFRFTGRYFIYEDQYTSIYPAEEQFWSLCIAKGIRVISGAKSSEQNDDKMNNLDDVILRHEGVEFLQYSSSLRNIVCSKSTLEL